MSSLALDTIPVVDISSLRGDDSVAQMACAQEIGRACSAAGFLYITGHGVADETVARAFECSRRLFALPAEQKEALNAVNSPAFRGFISTAAGLHTCKPKKEEDTEGEGAAAAAAAAAASSSSSSSSSSSQTGRVMKNLSVNPDGKDQKESFTLGAEDDPSDGTTSPMHGPNQGPTKTSCPAGGTPFLTTGPQCWQLQDLFRPA